LAGCSRSSTVPPPTQVNGQPAAGPAALAKPRDLETYMVLLDLGVYKSAIAPAFDRYISSGDAKAVRHLLPGAALPESPDRKNRLEAAQKVAPLVMESRCLVKLPGVEPYQLGGSELVSYLYSASDRLREALTSRDISEETLDYPLGEHTEIIRAEDAAEIRVNIRKVPSPEDAGLKTQLAGLLRMMDAAAGNSRLSLALVMK
jgi:hypothetical protein